MKDLFISYAHEDVEAAQHLATQLEAAGISVWWDPHLRAGQEFAREIEQVLEQVHCVVVLWSEHSVASRWVRAEATEGIRLEKLVPVSLDGTTPPLEFRTLHTTQLDSGELDRISEDYAKLIDDIRVRLGKGSTGGKHPQSRIQPYPWRYPIAIALGVVCSMLLLAAMDWSSQILDGLTCSLAASPLHLTTWATEAVLLSITLLLTLMLGWRIHRQRYRHRWWIAVTGLVALIGISIVYTWTTRWLAPAVDHISGGIVASDWNEMHILAVDALGREISLGGEVPVSTENGEFGMRVATSFADRPRRLIVRKPGCADFHYPLSWHQWNDQQPATINYKCQPER
jgi:hypothetical protein